MTVLKNGLDAARIMIENQRSGQRGFRFPMSFNALSKIDDQFHSVNFPYLYYLNRKRTTKDKNADDD